MKWKQILVTVLLGTAAVISGADIVKNGVAKASIVIPSNATEAEKYASEEFAKYVKAITGVELKTGTRPVEGMLPVRFGVVGADSLVMTPALKEKTDRLQNDGFVLEAGRNGVQIVTATRLGLHYGNYYVISRFFGVYFFEPDDEEYIPKAKDLSIPDQLTLKNPVFMGNFAANGIWTPSRRMNFIYKIGGLCRDFPKQNTTYKPFLPNLELGRKLGFYETPFWTTGYLTPLLVGSWNVKAREELFKEHPEYFGMRDGKRVITAGEKRNARAVVSQPCLGNPAVTDRIFNTIVRNIDQGRHGRKIIFRFENDDHGDWCECPECSKWDDPSAGPRGKVSDRWWHYVNGMSKRLFDRYGNDISIEVFAYQTFREVPKKILPLADPRIKVQVCPHGRCYLHTIDDPECKYNAQYEKMFRAWWNAGMHVKGFDYFGVLPGRANGCYLPLERTWVKDMRFFIRNNKGALYETRFDEMTCGAIEQDYPYFKEYGQRVRWRALWQTCWMTGHFSWDPDDDIDKVWEDVNSKYYGPAWKYIREYRLALEKAHRDARSHASYEPGNIAMFGLVYEQPGFAQKAETLLAQALKAAENDPVVLRRIVMEKELFTRNYKEAGFSHFGDKLYTVNRTEGTIRMDGVPDDPDWLKAPALESFLGPKRELTVGKFTNEKADPGTKLKVLFNSENIYFSLECLKASAGEKCAAGEGNVSRTVSQVKFPWSAAHVEFLIMTKKMVPEGKYYQLAFTPDGYAYATLWDCTGKADDTQAPEYEWTTADGPDRWTAELRIPLKAMGGIQPGDMWKINVGRTALLKDGAKTQNTSIGDGAFRNPADFKVFAFGEVPLILNGSFEETVGTNLRKGKSGKWEFLSAELPTEWEYLAGTPGKAELCSGDAPDGKVFIRIAPGSSAHPYLYQAIRCNEAGVKGYRLTLKARGKGMLRAEIKLYPSGKQMVKHSFGRPGSEWKALSCDLMTDAMTLKRLYFQVGGGPVEIDDVKLEALK
ncbi:MAG: hypothetical protein BWY31_02159 [Lentisphaerae bacterium ADurb.Bin242]|nr:MAG: hypothetical protein BWY31_02159 [Lentisphaerae bacterium ADurb.Bin242]